MLCGITPQQLKLMSAMRDPIRDYDNRDLNDFKDWSANWVLCRWHLYR
jgi:hypothetical protein